MEPLPRASRTAVTEAKLGLSVGLTARVRRVDGLL